LYWHLLLPHANTAATNIAAVDTNTAAAATKYNMAVSDFLGGTEVGIFFYYETFEYEWPS
jgi:hypothetical protein